MPAVAKKKPATRRKTQSPKRKTGRQTKAKSGALQRTGARLDGVFGNLWSSLLTYAAVGFTALGLLVLFMLFAGGYFSNIPDRLSALSETMVRGAGFSVARVTLKGGTDLAERDVMQALWTDEKGSVIGRSLFHVDAEEARTRLESIGAVRYAAVTKLWPDTVHVSVTMRQPEALWQDEAGVLHLVDVDGVSLRPVSSNAHTDLPVIVGTRTPAGAMDILAELRRRPALLSAVAAIVSVGDRRYDLRFRNDFTAKLPQDDVGAALDRLQGLGAGTGDLAESLDYIDLRDPKWAYYKPKQD
ncbi:cell division protein FtsQ/DivIB [Parvularcula oceani]|uniref:cell division protein FtsQ/DivIB n=1 Tax=Parvularcula oceani TaxID=1247963 RepID=UPI0004E12C17|nr:cell division protein FtsQ/DivIB [Parvularcula oceani]